MHSNQEIRGQRVGTWGPDLRCGIRGARLNLSTGITHRLKRLSLLGSPSGEQGSIPKVEYPAGGCSESKARS